MLVENLVFNSEQQFRALIEHSNDITIVLDSDQKLLYRSPSAYWITGYSNEDIGDRCNSENIHQEDREAVTQAVDRAMAAPEKSIHLRYRSRHQQGHWLVLDGMLTNLLHNEAVRGIVLHLRDITQQSIQEGELKENNERLRLLQQVGIAARKDEQNRVKHALLRAQEKERNAIALELHDNVNQLLVGTSLFLSLLKKNPAKMEEILPECIAHINGAIEENRKIAHKYSSPELTETSLVEQFERLAAFMLAPAGITARLEVEGFDEQPLDCEQKINLYRIAQEQCSNIVKYAHAKNALITLRNSRDAVHLYIKDDGVGMPAEQKIKGIGLKNIRVRTGVFKGSLKVETAPGRGFALLVNMPVQ